MFLATPATKLSNDEPQGSPKVAMSRTYAGILGVTAFSTMVIRGLLNRGSLEATMQSACVGLFAFAMIGFVAGEIAALIVSDSVRRKFATELRAAEAKPNRK